MCDKGDAGAVKDRLFLPAAVVILVSVIAGCTILPPEGKPDTTTASADAVLQTHEGGWGGDVQTAVSEQRPNTKVAIYSAALRQMCTKDHSLGTGVLAASQVYLVSWIDEWFHDPALTPQASVRLPEGTQQKIVEALHDLPAEFIWIDSLVDVPMDASTGIVAGGDGVVITLGNIHMRQDGSALVSVDLHCRTECAVGVQYIVEVVSGTSHVTGKTGRGRVK